MRPHKRLMDAVRKAEYIQPVQKEDDMGPWTEWGMDNNDMPENPDRED